MSEPLTPCGLTLGWSWDCISMRSLRAIGVTQKLQLLFHHVLAESLLCHDIFAWIDNLRVQSDTKITKLIPTAMKIIGVCLHPILQAISQQTLFRHTQKLSQTDACSPVRVSAPTPQGDGTRVPLSRLQQPESCGCCYFFFYYHCYFIVCCATGALIF